MCRLKVFLLLTCIIISTGPARADELKDILKDYPELTKLFVYPCGVKTPIDRQNPDLLKKELKAQKINFTSGEMGTFGELFKIEPTDMKINGVEVDEILITLSENMNNVAYRSIESDGHEKMTDWLAKQLTPFNKITDPKLKPQLIYSRINTVPYFLDESLNYTVTLNASSDFDYSMAMLSVIREPEAILEGLWGSPAKTKRHRNIAIACASILALLLITGCIIYFRKQQQLKYRLAAVSRQLDSASAVIEEKETEVARLKGLQSGYIRKMYSQLYKLLYDYHHTTEESSEKLREQLRRQIDKHISEIKSPSSKRKLQEELNLMYGDVMKNILAENPRLRKDELFITLLLSGFNAKSICLICDISIENYYTKKSRFMDKAEELSPELKNRVLTILES